MPAGRPATQHTSHRQPRLNLVVCADRAYRQPTNVQPSVGANSAVPDSPAGGEGDCCPSILPKNLTLALGFWPPFLAVWSWPAMKNAGLTLATIPKCMTS